MKTRRIWAVLVFASLLLSGSAYGDWSDTFLGQEAGSYCNTCVRDTFIGYRAGCLNVSTSDNTYVGFSAGYGKPLSAPITGIQNTFIGSVAGENIIGGAQNTFVGYKAGTLNTDGSHNTFIGNRAGYGYVAATSTSSSYNTFVGDDAGQNINTGTKNTALGHAAGFTNNNGHLNIFIGESAGYYNYGHWNTIIGPFAGMNNSTGSANVFLGANAGSAETGSNRLYIDNCNVKDGSGNCTIPLIYGEFDNRKVTLNGYVGIGTQAPSYPLQMAGGAYTNGTQWIDVSSRDYKDQIERLSSEEAFATLKGLDPVKYVYRADKTEQRVGFIAEDVPDLVATKGRKGLSPMDIVAVLTKVVQGQQKELEEQQKTMQEQNKTISMIREELKELKGRVR